MLKQICASLNEAHNIGLIHRDIKAANIVLCCRAGEYDVVKVLDFGLVRDVGEQPDDQSEKISGTPHYLSPEAILSPAQVDNRSDIYALGILACHLLTANYPFENTADPRALLLSHVNKEPRKPSDLVKFDIPDDLETVIMSCLECERDDRPANVMILAAALEACECSADWNAAKAALWWSQQSDTGLASDTAIIPGSEIERTIQVAL